MAADGVTTRCGHCYRPATVAIVRQTPARKLLGMAPETFRVCRECVSRYRRPSRWRRG